MKNVLSLIFAAFFAISIGLIETASAATTPYVIGVFPPSTSYNGGYSTVVPFSTLMGISNPAIENFYTDGTMLPGNNGANWEGSSNYDLGGFESASENGGPNNSTNPWLPSSGVIPLGDMPMGTTTSTSGALSLDTYLQNIAAGDYDTAYKGVIADWYNAGYHTQYWRPGVEFNEYGNVYNCGTDMTCMTYWRAAWDRIYTDMHSEASAIGANVTVIWNPGADAGGQADPSLTTTYWPGASYVDQIGLDLYDNSYPDNSSNTCPNYTNVTANAGCENQGGGTAFGLHAALAFAKAQGKAVSFDETGASDENPLFFQWFAAVLKATTTQIAFISFWDSNGGCPCQFTPSGSAGKPNTAAAIAANFGAGAPGGSSSGITSAANTQVNGPIGSITDTNGNVWSINTSGYLFENSTEQSTSYTWKTIFWTGSVLYVQSVTTGTWTTINLTSGAGTPASGPSGYTAPHAASPANTQLNSTVGTIYDQSGNIWAINSNQQITVNGNVVTSSANVVSLLWSGTALYQLNTSGDWYTQPLDASTGVATTTPTGYTAPHAASPANTQINGTTGTIYDTTGDSFAINSSQQIVENGTVISSSANVVTLFWTGSVLDQLNTSGAWYTQPTNGTAGAATTAPTGYVAPVSAVAINITPTTQTVTTTDVTDAKPFTGMTISDTNTNQTESATVTINQTANGILKDPYSSTDGSVITNGILTVSGTSSAVITALGNVLFTPTKNQVIGGSSVTTTITVAIVDTATKTASATSTVIATQIATHAASAADTQVSGTSGVIYDTNGNAWIISSSGQEEENGLVVNNSSGITTLFWNGTALFQLNTSGVWLTQPLNGSVGSVTTTPSGYTGLPSLPLCPAP